MEDEFSESSLVEPQALASAPPAIRVCEAAVRDPSRGAGDVRLSRAR